MDRSAAEVSGLKQKVVDLETEAGLLRQQLRELQSVRADSEAVSEELNKVKRDLDWANTQTSRKAQECEELKKLIQNLQTAI